MMPNGWKKGVIEDIAKVSSGGTPSRQNDSYWLGGYIPWVTTAEVKFGVITDTEQKITEEGLKNSSAKLFPKNTILMAMYGQGKTRGQVAKLGIEASTNQACAALQLNEGFEVDYYYQYLVSQYENIRDLANSGGQQNLSGGIIKGIHVPMPPLPEQRKIGNILGVWDKSISTIERLVDNSKQQKKALTQQLLTGKKRLSNFDAEWKEIKLADVGKCITGLTYSPSDIVDKGGMLVLRSSNIQHGKLAFKDNVFVSSDLAIKSKTQDGDILVCVRNGSKNLIGKSALIKGKATNQAHGAFMTLFRCKYPDYAFQLFQSSNYYRQVHKNLGATINSINTSDLHKFKFMMPTDENEINAIATCLSNADKEVELLVQQLADLKQEKKALMQQLLTGKRRVLI